MYKKKVFAILAAALLLELFYFNGSYFYGMIRRERPYNVTFSLNDFETANWEKQSTGLLSQQDPMLYRLGVDANAAEVEIRARTNRPIPYAFVFYTDSVYQDFCEQTMILADNKGDGLFTAQLPGEIQDIRVDLGDDPGLELYDFTLCINPLRFEFSAARFTAMLIVCFGFWGLIWLQRFPDYNLKNTGGGKVEKEGQADA